MRKRIAIVPIVLAQLVIIPALAQTVRVWEEEVTIPTYPLGPEDPHPHYYELEGSLYYPYTAQDRFSATKEPRSYRAWFLENETIKLMCLPEIGGRIQYVYDKRRNEPMFYHNRVIRPGMIALRGAWVSGGIEWNRGPQGHTVTSFSPVDVTGVSNPDGSATLVIGETERVFRTGWEVRLTLHPGKTYLDESITLFNPTDGYHPYYFWNNTAFPNRAGTRFMFPMTIGTDHDGLNFFSWPEHEGRDLTWLKNYEAPTSIFAYRSVFDFFGAYDVDRDFGIVQVANHRILPGKKAWTWGQAESGLVSQSVLTDEDGPYIEVQSGPLPTQADFATLAPGQSVEWREIWYPVFGLHDGFEYANESAAVQRLEKEDGSLEFRLMSTEVFDDLRLNISRDGNTLFEETIDLDLSHAEAISVSGATARDSVELKLFDRRGRVLLAYRSPLEIPMEIEPSLDEAKAPASAGDWLRLAREADRQMNRREAREAYMKALSIDPAQEDARLRLAILDFESAEYEKARHRVAPLLRRDGDGWAPWHLAGVVALAEQDYGAAKAYGHEASKRGGTAQGLGIVGRAHMALGETGDAVEAFTSARQAGADSVRVQEQAWIARYADRDSSGASRSALGEETMATIEAGSIRPIPYALQALMGALSMDAFAKRMSSLLGEPEPALIEMGIRFAELYRFGEAVRLVDLGLNATESGPTPLADLYLAYWSHRAGNSADAKRFMERGLARSRVAHERVFPFRAESISVLDFAWAESDDSDVALFQGNLHAGLGRFGEAIGWWERAVERDADNGLALRNLGMTHWRLGHQLERAASAFERAVDSRPGDLTLVRDLAAVRVAQGRSVEAIRLLEPIPSAERRPDMLLQLARAYSAVGRLDDSIDLLASTTFSNREGDASTWQVFSDAHIRRGRLRLDRGDGESALRDFDTALTYPRSLNVGRPHEPREARALYWKAVAERALGRSEAARSSFEQCLQMKPLDDEAAAFRARCASELGEVTQRTRN